MIPDNYQHPCKRCGCAYGDHTDGFKGQCLGAFSTGIAERRCPHQCAGYVLAELPADSVDHPAHYTSGQIEVIDFIEDQQLGFHLGNAVKYIARAGKKDPAKTAEDLKKARWYLDRHIAQTEKE